MSSKDIRNNAEVHSILVRNYLNVRRLDSTATGETVTIKGILEVTREADSVDAAVSKVVALRTLDKVEEEIKKIPGINYVKWNLDNWVRLGRRWVEAQLPTFSSRKESASVTPRVLELIKRIKKKLWARGSPRSGTGKRPTE